MRPLPTSNHIPYLPDGYADTTPHKTWRLASTWGQALVFLFVFAVLQWLYGLAPDSRLQRLFVETLGTQPAAALIHIATPAIPVQAIGARLTAPGGGITIRGGCEGTEVLFLLIAAFVAAPLPWRRRLTGMALGALLVFVGNQARIVSLFYAYRSDHAWFDQLHTVIAPIVLVTVMTLYFYAWIRRDVATAA